MNEELLKASKRWKEEGKAYKDKINQWLDTIYIKEENPRYECLEETRSDMASYVLNEIDEYNKRGKFNRIRELFPPDSDPLMPLFQNESIWLKVYKVTYLPDGRILAKVGNAYSIQAVFMLDGNEVTLLKDRNNPQNHLIAYGLSRDKKYFAKIYKDSNTISIYKGWDGNIK